MTKRSDIVDGSMAASQKYGLIYTKKCGWVDLGHANPGGASELWNQVSNESGKPSLSKPGYHTIAYKQMMGNKYVKVGRLKRFEIKKGLSDDKKKSVALAIFLNVSKDFESFQGNWLFKHFTNSSFSAEDLVSNLIGFYRALEPKKQILQMCEPVRKDIALEIWDTYGPVGENKNYTTVPYVIPTAGYKKCGTYERTSP